MTTAAIMLCSMLLTVAGIVRGEPASQDIAQLQAQIESLRDGQAAMLEELRLIKVLLQKAPAASVPAGTTTPIGSVMPLERARINGAADAGVVVVEFSDFQCPFCARHATGTYRDIVRTYVDTGRIRYAFVDFPIESLHPNAFRQHIAAACAADQGRFWKMHDRLFADQQATDPGALVAHANAVGLDAAAFSACLHAQNSDGDIRLAMQLGASLGVTGTPTFLIGVATAGQKLRVTQVITGAKSFSVFQEAIDAALATIVPTNAARGPARAGIVSTNAIDIDRRGR